MSVSQLSPLSDQPDMRAHWGVSCVNTSLLERPCTSAFLCRSKTSPEQTQNIIDWLAEQDEDACNTSPNKNKYYDATCESGRKRVHSVSQSYPTSCPTMRNSARHTNFGWDRASSDSGNRNIYPINGRHNLQRKLLRDWGFRAGQQVPQYLAQA